MLFDGMWEKEVQFRCGETTLKKHQLILYDKLFVSCSLYRNQQENPIVAHTTVRIRFCWHI